MVAAWCLCVGLALAAAEGLPATIDFEQGPQIAHYTALAPIRVDARIVAGGPSGSQHCLELKNASPASECGVLLKGPIAVCKNLTLAFDYQAEIEPGYDLAYLGMAFMVGGKQWFWTSDDVQPGWRHVEVYLPRLKSSGEHVMRAGLEFSEIRLYGRVKEQTAGKRETKARMTVRFDNLQWHTAPLPPTVGSQIRTSYANPPMFDWPRAAAGVLQRVQWSRDPAFPPGKSFTADAPTNFYLPPQPLEPGTWYWRHQSPSDLGDGWSEAGTIIIPAAAHRFATAAVPAERLAKTPHPRLAPLARIDQPEVTPQRKAQLIKDAQKIFKRGVPEHPGPHVPGDPRWPTWIDWYGKVAGGITGGTGQRLETLGQIAMLTADLPVQEQAKDLLLQACTWDPEGGSAMKLGDIGAQHLLRGMSWCYDAAYDRMTSDERARARAILVQRARQFADRLLPFRGSEANNHAWLQGLALAEAGIVLIGEHAEAADWVEGVRQLYISRFLACLGYQGDNNEGISYWGYGLGFVVKYGDLMRSVCDIDIFRHPWLSQTARFPMYTAPPGAWAVSFADTGMPNHGIRGPAQTRQVRDLAVRTRDPYALWYSGATEPVDGLAPQPPVDLPQSIHYRHIGVVVFNTSLVDGLQGATVALHSGKYFAAHQHPDQNGFVIHAYGEKLAIDGGYYDWYGSPHFKAYSMTTLAHNTLLVDGQGQADRKPGADGRITAYHDAPHYGYTVGDASANEIYGGRLKRFERRVLFIKPGFVIVHDLVQPADNTAELDWLLHAVTPIEVAADRAAFSIALPKAALRGRFLGPQPPALAVQTGFPVEPVDRYSTRPVPKDKYFPEWTLHAKLSGGQRAVEYLATMQIQRLADDKQPPATIEPFAVENGYGIRVKCGPATHLVLLRAIDKSGPLTGEGLTCDGDIAAVELDAGGKPAAAFAAHARSLQYRQQDLFRGAQPKDWSTP